MFVFWNKALKKIIIIISWPSVATIYERQIVRW